MSRHERQGEGERERERERAMMYDMMYVTEHFWVLVPDMILVMLSEFVVDWVKHAFITKFNEIPSEVS